MNLLKETQAMTETQVTPSKAELRKARLAELMLLQEELETTPIPQKVKDFVNILKKNKIFLMYDAKAKNGLLTYEMPDGIDLARTLPESYIDDEFYRYIKSPILHDRYLSYVKSCFSPIVGTTYDPDGRGIVSKGMSRRANLYESLPLTDSSKDCPLFLELLERLFKCPEEREVFTQWIAHMIQKPAERPSWGCILTSDQGTGKSYLSESILIPLLNNQGTLVDTFADFCGSHATALAHTQLVVIDDAKTTSASTTTKLKSKVSAKTLLLNPKYQQPYRQKVYARVMFNSNEKNPLKLSTKDTRRWFVPEFITHKVDGKETSDFITRLSEWLFIPNTRTPCPDSLSRIHNYLMSYDITGFNPNHVAMTPTLSNMVEDSLPAQQMMVRDWILERKIFKLTD